MSVNLCTRDFGVSVLIKVILEQGRATQVGTKVFLQIKYTLFFAGKDSLDVDIKTSECEKFISILLRVEGTHSTNI